MRFIAYRCDRCAAVEDVPFVQVEVAGLSWPVPDPTGRGPKGWVQAQWADQTEDYCRACCVAEELEQSGTGGSEFDLCEFEDDPDE